jgi:DNA-binding MarR family transcriptional regulator
MMETLTPEQIAVSRSLERLISWFRDAREPADISASAISALSRLETGGPLRVTDLAYREGLTQPGMTTLIHRLESAGLALREQDPTDGRAVRVTITDAGIARVTAHRAARAAMIGARLGQLTPDDQHALVAALPALNHFSAETTPSIHKK